ncbi:MAG TPA: DUF2934 domain-containing protein [Phycisphaeraceae bacterium]
MAKSKGRSDSSGEPQRASAVRSGSGASSAPRAQARTRGSKRPANSANPSGAVVTLTHEEIARRAYEIWLAKGKPIGQDEQNWHEAERELRAARQGR